MSAADRAAAAAARDRQKSAAGVDKPSTVISDNEVGVKPLDEVIQTSTKTAPAPVQQARPLQTRSEQGPDLDAYEQELAERREEAKPQLSPATDVPPPGLPEAPQLAGAFAEQLERSSAESQAAAARTGYTDSRRVAPGQESPQVPLVTRSAQGGANRGLPRSGSAK